MFPKETGDTPDSRTPLIVAAKVHCRCVSQLES